LTDDERAERAERSRAAAEATLERLADVEVQVDESARSHHDPVRRGWATAGRREPEPSPPIERGLTDSEWTGGIEAKLEARLAEEREFVRELLAQLLAQVEAKLDGAADELRREVAKVSASFDTLIRVVGPRNDGGRREEAIDLPPLPIRRTSLN
jgi:hypothetical protein